MFRELKCVSNRYTLIVLKSCLRFFDREKYCRTISKLRRRTFLRWLWLSSSPFAFSRFLFHDPFRLGSLSLRYYVIKDSLLQSAAVSCRQPTVLLFRHYILCFKPCSILSVDVESYYYALRRILRLS